MIGLIIFVFVYLIGVTHSIEFIRLLNRKNSKISGENALFSWLFIAAFYMKVVFKKLKLVYISLSNAVLKYLNRKVGYQPKVISNTPVQKVRRSLQLK